MYALKPLLMISLGVFFYSVTKANTKFFKFILLGIIFSFFGDVFLMFDEIEPLFFIAGLGSFLIAHICYVIAFLRDIKNTGKPLSNGQKATSIIPFLVFSSTFFFLIKDGLGDMLVPVLAYTLVISLMGITASMRANNTSRSSFIWVLVGAIMFILSDSTIALNKFVFTSPDTPLPYARIIIMGLYITAQYFIAMGSLKTKAELKPA